MARTKIKDLPRNKSIKQEEMKLIKGGGSFGKSSSGLGFLANPGVLLAPLVAAIAIPLAIGPDYDDAS